jgi:hypothetical protein
MTIGAIEFDDVSVRNIRNNMGRPKEVAFRLLCRPSPSSTVLRVTADVSGDRVGKGLDVAPSPSNGRPCLFAHTHTCRADRRHSPPSLNDFVSLINDCVIRVAKVPVAVVGACERGGGRVYVYDCVSRPTEVEPVSAADFEILRGAAASARDQDEPRHTEALEFVVGVLEARGGRPYDLLAVARANRRACPRWVEYVTGAALASDSRCELDYPEWMEPYLSRSTVDRRGEDVAGQLTSLETGRASTRHLRAWHCACRDVPLDRVDEAGNLVVRL